MSYKLGVVFTCAHASPETSNERFTWLGKFLYDLKPDLVIDLGDGADMKSLNSFDTRKPEAIVSQSYERDINIYNDAQERIRWEFVKNRKKKPAFYGFEGNHENRIKTAISYDPRLEGKKYGISFSHLNTNKWFDEYHEYHNSAPAIHNYHGVDFAHFVGAGNYGRPISGVHHAYGLIQHRYRSTIVGHSHKRDVYFKDNAKAIGVVAGCFKGADETWAGQSNGDWWKGLVVLHNLSGGLFEPQFVSLETLRRQYQ